MQRSTLKRSAQKNDDGPLKASIFGISGVPNFLKSVNSKFYFNLDLIQLLLTKFFFGRVTSHEYRWPNEVPLPLFGFSLKRFPFAIPVYFFMYRYHSGFRKKVLHKAEKQIEALLKNPSPLFIVAHSHGTNITLDALNQMKISKRSKIYLILLAPAHERVLFGLFPFRYAVSKSAQNQAWAKVKGVFYARIDGDILSSDPDHPQAHTLPKSSWRHYIPGLSHSLIMTDYRLLDELKLFLKKNG